MLMSSQQPENHWQVTRTESSCGWLPSEKVQAMSGGHISLLYRFTLPLICLAEEHDHAKRASEHHVREKAKQRKTLARKCEQVSQVAEIDPFMVATLKAPSALSRGQAASPVNLDLDTTVCNTPACNMVLTTT